MHSKRVSQRDPPVQIRELEYEVNSYMIQEYLVKVKMLYHSFILVRTIENYTGGNIENLIIMDRYKKILLHFNHI